MPRAFAWILALRYLLTRPVTWLGVGGIALAVWALVVVIAVFSGFIGSIRDDVRHSAPDLLVTDLPLDQSFQALQPAVAADGDVLAVAPRLRHYGTYHQLVRGALVQHSSTVEFNNRDSDFVQLLGIDPGREAEVTPLRDWLVQPTVDADPAHAFAVPPASAYHGRERAGLPLPPRLVDFDNRWPGIRLGRARMRQHWLQPGDPIELLTAAVDRGADGKIEVLPVSGRFVYAGPFETGHRLFDDATALLPIEALRTLLGHDPESDGSIDIVTDIAVALRPGADAAAVAERLRTAVQALLPPTAAQCSVLTWEQQNKVFLDAVEIERAMMKLVLLAVMLIAGFLIYATLHMMVMQKVKDIGILGALGGSPQSLGSIFAVCGFVTGLLGCLSGALLGAVTTLNLNPILDFLGIQLFPPDMYDLKEVPARLDPLWLLQVTTGAFVLSLLVSWLPARKAARLNPVQALSYE